MTDFPYQDEDGEPVHRVVKKELQNGKKTFYQQHWDGSRWVKGVSSTETVPYHLPLVLDAIDRGEDPIWIVEGEKDADTGYNEWGIITTTNSGGAGKWRDHHSRFLRGAEKVYIVWDRDEEGHAHAWAVYDSLRKHGIPDIYFRCAREGKDLTDHINAGWSRNDLVRKKPPRPKVKETRVVEDTNDGQRHLSAAFQLALLKLHELGPVQVEDREEHQYNALCPAHDDSDPSLTIRPGREGDSVGVLVHCFAGCSSDAIADALGIEASEFTHIEQAQESRIEALAEREYERIIARRTANQKIAKENLRSEPVDWSKARIGTDELNMPLEPVHYLVEDWFVYGTFTLLIADPKAGKTRLSMNLMQALTEGKPFLGKYATDMAEGARCLYLNYDMGENQFRRYLKDYTWQNQDGFIVQHLLAGQFNFWESEKFDQFVEFALNNNVQMLFMDTFAMASQGYVTDENNNTEVAGFCSEIRKLKEAAAIPNVLMLHHRGRSKEEHGRGASSFDASVDALWYLGMDDRISHDAPRSLRAKGREVGQSPIQLVYDEAQELYTTDGRAYSAGSGDSGPVADKRVVKCAQYCRAIKSYFDDKGAWPRGKVARGLAVGSENVRAEIMAEALELGLTLHTVVAGRSYEVSLTEDGLAAMNPPGVWYVDKGNGNS